MITNINFQPISNLTNKLFSLIKEVLTSPKGQETLKKVVVVVGSIALLFYAANKFLKKKTFKKIDPKSLENFNEEFFHILSNKNSGFKVNFIDNIRRARSAEESEKEKLLEKIGKGYEKREIASIKISFRIIIENIKTNSVKDVTVPVIILNTDELEKNVQDSLMNIKKEFSKDLKNSNHLKIIANAFIKYSTDQPSYGVIHYESNNYEKSQNKLIGNPIVWDEISGFEWEKIEDLKEKKTIYSKKKKIKGLNKYDTECMLRHQAKLFEIKPTDEIFDKDGNFI